MQIPEDIIIRSIQRTATEEELNTLSKWLEESETNSSIYFQFEEIWNTRKRISEYSIRQGWEMLAKQIEKQPQQPVNLKIKQKYMWWCYVAATFIGILITSIIWLGKPTKETLHYQVVQNVVFNKSGVQSIVLPDQSEVWLNENSRLSYPEEFSQKKRQVDLSGNAYFNIHKDANRPFYVQIGKLTIEVTGTEFFVESATDNTSSIVLITGKVNLNYQDNKGMSVLTPLFPGEQALVNSINGTVEIEKVDVNYYRTWKDGTYRFTDEKLENIAAMLAQHYEIDIYVDSSLKNKRFTGRVIAGENVESVLKSMSKSYPIKYHITDNFVEISD